MTLNPVSLTQALIRCPSVTPVDEGALAVLENALKPLGFDCHRLSFQEEGTPDVHNLYARLGGSGRHLCFAGHTDVVPVGDAAGWKHPPFGAEIVDGVLYGRGAVDMKAAIACFAAAASEYIAHHRLNGSISLLITGDEEGPAINGTKKVLHWMKERGERLDACIVGEPTNPDVVGEMAKIGRRGSVTFTLSIRGVQGHAAYPHLADNPIHPLVGILHTLSTKVLDEGNTFFQPSSLQITTVDVGNPANNVIPAHAHATFNIRFNNEHSSGSLIRWVEEVCAAHSKHFTIKTHITGESFLTEPGHLSDIVSAAVKDVTGLTPELSTTGGTSDARFIKDLCPVVEFGLINKTAHKVDECASVEDILKLTTIYKGIIERFFA